jgi:predicted acylesterase/phospholipase RssA
MSLMIEFVDWYTRKDGSRCPFTLDQLIELLADPEQRPHEVRRVVLRQIRATLAQDPRALQSDPLLAGRFNEWREELAKQYLTDIEIHPADRFDAALQALLEPLSEADDLERRETLWAAGDALGQRGAHRMNPDDLVAATSYFKRAWQAVRAPRQANAVRRAVALLMRLANESKPAAAEDRRKEAEELCGDLIGVAESTLRSARDRLIAIVADRLCLLEAPLEADRIWEGIEIIIRSIPSVEVEAQSPAFSQPLDEIWDAVLALTYSYAALGQWKRAREWDSHLTASNVKLHRLHGHGLDLEQRRWAMLRDVVEVASYAPPAPGSPEASPALASLLEPLIRERLGRWFAAQRPRKSLEDAKERLQKTRTYPLDPHAIEALVENVLRSTRRGRVGLALSGGGFRASFFHLGVLAHLAEVDLLRSVEVISCVSGGSIVGACYYLKLKQLLEQKHDVELRRTDYIRLVESLCDGFLQGVQRNIRTRIFADVAGIVRLWFVPGYTRTDRVAELLESELFARVTDDPVAARAPMWQLAIAPKGEDPEVTPEADNWRRSAKIPKFVINATTVNTGHNWQFTPVTAGEPAFAVDRAIDATPRLHAFKYPRNAWDRGPRESKTIRLGTAVAASACVPIVFPPISLPRLYDRVLIKLLDGGVFDNQGLSALIDERCNVVIASDGSGQLRVEMVPAVYAWSTLRRTNAMLMERVRQLQFRALQSSAAAASLRESIVVHLTKGLAVEPIDWIGRHDPDWLLKSNAKSKRMMDTLTAATQGIIKYHETPYGIAEDVQRSLAAVRTDLDSFHQGEAYALFWSGYRMITQELSKTTIPEASAQSASEHAWPMAAPWRRWGHDPSWNNRLIYLLEASRFRFFKVARLKPRAAKQATAAIAVLFALAGWLARRQLASAAGVLPMLGLVGAYICGIAAVVATTRALFVTRKPADVVRLSAEMFQQLIVGCALPLAFVASRIHLRWFDRRYLEEGDMHMTDQVMHALAKEARARQR